jgi:hypothetical protein
MFKELKKCGLIPSRKKGRVTNYCIKEEGRKGIQTACE